ncbi:MAG: adenylyl-sulfate kinase [Chloroflexota bacterium]|nr:MAG: adenylyl-sulfate kinase [Chloroflexota bacterium]
MTDSRGVCIWFTGRSGAGKSTITHALLPLLDEAGLTVSVLDVVPLLKKRWCERTSEGKLLRKALVASEIVKHGGVVICVTVSARSEVREAARQLIGPDSFLEIYVDVPADVALARKAKRKHKPSRIKRTRHALRRQAARLRHRGHRAFDAPLAPALVIDAVNQPPEESARKLFQLLLDRGFVAPIDGQNGSPAGADASLSRPELVVDDNRVEAS